LETRCLEVDLLNCDHRVLSRIIYQLIKLGGNPGNELWQSFMHACEALGFGDFNPEDLAHMVESLVHLKCDVDEGCASAFVSTCLARGLSSFPVDMLCRIAASLAKLQVGGSFWDELDKWCSSNGFQGFDKPEQVTMLAQAFGLVRREASTAFLESFIAKCRSIGLCSFDARGLCIIIGVLALHGGVTDQFLKDFVSACEKVGLDTFERRFLTIIRQSLVRLGGIHLLAGWPN